uniref:Uncharacterized protein n=1 Tax=Zooxanthella nutricula TaxID=1333877 RepID=A0A7S2VMD7_9DINO|mmetsp:Transcript_86036/g.263280  ORF Transcript_86036/g.263280 Transcript_86036/m.263280 type:complete len:243 (+) Transcript_86036:93-821(+)
METTVWRTGEYACSRNSFNAIVLRKEFDPPRDIMNMRKMGKKSMVGPDYVPNGIYGRVVAGTLDPDGHHVLEAVARKAVPVPTTETFSASLRSTLRAPRGEAAPEAGPEAPEAPALEPRPEARNSLTMSRSRAMSDSQITINKFATMTRPATVGVAKVADTKKAYKGSGGCTVNWRPGETDMTRHSFNKMVREPYVSKRTFDAPESLARSTTMGRQAERGAKWVPNSIGGRRVAGMLPYPKK